MLEDAAFETGALFDTQLIENTGELVEDVLADFFRENFYDASEFTNNLLRAKNLELSDLSQFVISINDSLNPQFIPEKIDLDPDPLEIKEIINRLGEFWDRSEIEKKLDGKMKKPYRDENLEQKIEQIEELIAGSINSTNLAVVAEFTNSSIREGSFASVDEDDIPGSDFFDLCDKLNERINNFSYAVRLNCYKYYRDKFKQHKQQQNIKTYDDMIEEVRRRVTESAPAPLKKYIRNRYRVALVDEFQDTSPAQYEIFKNVFIEGSQPIFFVGDPKQAIYKFRGGDIYTYNRARKNIPREKRHSLNKNWRSLPNLVEVFNFLFSDKMGERPFANQFINYSEVNYREYQPDRDLQYKNEPEKSPFKILFKDDKTNTREMTEFASRETAARIYQILNNEDYQIGGQDQKGTVKPEDIAVLVDKHDNADQIKDELKEWNIPVTVQATGNIFETEEARDMELLINAINDSRNLQIVKALLSTKLFGIDCNRLIEYSQSQNDTVQREFEQWLNFIRECRKIWSENNFIETMNHLIDKLELKKRLLGLKNGERIVTNILHLTEIIHHYEEQSNDNISGILKWFNKKREQPGDDTETENLRLETDRSAVRVMTVHRSKGLEFPIVFCPFLWSRTVHIYDRVPKFHDEKGKYYIDLTKDDEHKNLAEDENLEELMRLLYVALTRAEAQCYVIWGKLAGKGGKKKKSGLAYLFHRNKLTKKDLIKGNISDSLGSKLKLNNYLPDEQKLHENIELIKKKDKYDSVLRYEEEKIKLLDEIKEFTGDTEVDWSVSSFSSIIEYESGITNNYFDYDQVDNIPLETEPEDEETYTIFDFPGGVKTGNCWHKIFEELDFQSVPEEVNRIVQEKLNLYNLISGQEDEKIARQKQESVVAMVNNVLEADLNKKGLQLNNIKKKDKLAEMEFSLSMQRNVAPDKLNKILQNNGYNIQLKSGIPVGMLRGFIDLIFRHDGKYYILDWKSNRIADNYSGYNRQNLDNEMRENNYYLQYLLYTVALLKHLGDRLGEIEYEEIFGGVYYIFLRGVNKEISGNGIYFDYPEESLVEKLLALLE
jgi:exodeoxyribonuclease V beta subunit